jgi:hypothetical protein
LQTIGDRLTNNPTVDLFVNRFIHPMCGKCPEHTRGGKESAFNMDLFVFRPKPLIMGIGSNNNNASTIWLQECQRAAFPELALYRVAKIASSRIKIMSVSDSRYAGSACVNYTTGWWHCHRNRRVQLQLQSVGVSVLANQDVTTFSLRGYRRVPPTTMYESWTRNYQTSNTSHAAMWNHGLGNLDVDAGNSNALWRCGTRYSTLHKAKEACVARSWCGGIVRDNGWEDCMADRELERTLCGQPCAAATNSSTGKYSGRTRPKLVRLRHAVVHDRTGAAAE